MIKLRSNFTPRLELMEDDNKSSESPKVQSKRTLEHPHKKPSKKLNPPKIRTKSAEDSTPRSRKLTLSELQGIPETSSSSFYLS